MEGHDHSMSETSIATATKSAAECEQYVGRLRDLCMGTGHQGRPDPALNYTNKWRAKRGLAPLTEPGGEPTGKAEPRSRLPLGDFVAAITKATGIARIVKRLRKGKCGCQRRQNRLNQIGEAMVTLVAGPR